MSVKDEFIKLGVKCSKYDPAVFYWHHNRELHGIICTHVDDFLFGGTNEFILNVMNPIKQKFVIGSECHTVFKYIGLNVNQLSDHSILVDQATYIDSIQEISISKERKGEKDSPLTEHELNDLRSVIGQLGWVAGQTRPDLAFDLCDLSSRIKNATVQDLLRANKVVIKAKSEHVVLRYQSFDDLRNLKLLTYNDSSFGNLKDEGSQGAFVIFIVVYSLRFTLVTEDCQRRKDNLFSFRPGPLWTLE